MRVLLTLLARLKRRVGHRGAVLLFLSLIDLIYGGTMLGGVTEASPTFHYAARILPLPAWGAVWALVGCACLVQAFMRRDHIAYGAAQGIKVIWAVVVISGWFSHQIPHGQVAGAIWIMAAGLVGVVSTWPEPARIPKGRG